MKEGYYMAALCVAQPNDPNKLPVIFKLSEAAQTFGIHYKYYAAIASSSNDDFANNKAGILLNKYSAIPDGLKSTLTYNLNSSWDPNAGKE